MSKSVRIRRGSTLDHQQFAGAEGEITIDTTLDTIRVHDGSTLGGFVLLNTVKNSVITAPELIANRILYKNSYTDQNSFPQASQYPGMVVYSQADQKAFISTGTAWNSFTQSSDLANFVESSSNTGNTVLDFTITAGKQGSNLVFKTIRAGNNIVLAQDNATITIAGSNYQGQSLSDGAGSFEIYSETDQDTNTLKFKNIRLGSGLSGSQSVSGNEINIDTVLKQAFNSVIVNGETIATTSVNNSLTLGVGSGLTASADVLNKTITFNLNLTATNDLTQTGEDVLSSYSSGDFVFNKIQAGDGVVLSSGANGEIVISAPQVGTVTGGENLGIGPADGGTGIALFESALSTASTLKFRRIRPGAGIVVTMSPDQEYMDISSTLETPGGAQAGVVNIGDQLQLAYYPTAQSSTIVGPTPVGISVDLSSSIFSGNPAIVADIEGRVSDISNHTTDDLSEGTSNLYYTLDRFETAFESKTTDHLTEGTTNLYFTVDRAKNASGSMLIAGNSAVSVTTKVVQASSSSAATLTVANTAGITVGMTVTSAGFPAGVTVQQILSSASFIVSPAVFARAGTSITLTGATTLILNVTADVLSTSAVILNNTENIVVGQYATASGITGRSIVQSITEDGVVLTPGYNVSLALGNTISFSSLTTTGLIGTFDSGNNTFSYRLDTNYLGNIIREGLSVIPGQGLTYDPVQGRFGLSGAVTSVNGLNGAVQLTVGDIPGAAPLANPIFTGSPRVPDLTVSSSNFQIANKLYVDTTRTSITGTTLPGLATLQALGNAINGDTQFFNTVNQNLALKLNTAGGTITGLLNLSYNVDYENSDDLVAVNKKYVDERSTVQTVNSKQGFVVLNTDDIFERSTPAPVNLWFTQARSRQSISLETDDPSTLSYNIGTGRFTFTKPTTDGIVEGVTNQYWTSERSRGAMGLSVTGSSTFASYDPSDGVYRFNATTDNIGEGTKKFYSDSLVYSSIQLQTSTSQDAFLTYNNGTGIFTINPRTSNIIENPAGPFFFSNARVYASISAVTTQLDNVIASQSLTFNSSTGQFTFNANTNNITEGSVNRYFTEARARQSITVSSNDQTILSYDNSTGIITYNRPNTDKISEGSTNLYFTQARARGSVSVTTTNTQNTGTSFISYSSSTGVFTVNLNIDSLNDGATNRFASVTRVAGIIGLTTTTADNIATALLSYNSTNGGFTFNNSTDSLREGLTNKWASAATVRGYLSANAQTALTYSSSTGVITFAPTVGASLVYTAQPGAGVFHFDTQQPLTSTSKPNFLYVTKSVNPGTSGGRVQIVSQGVSINCDAGTYHEVNRSGTITTLSFTNPPASGKYVEITVAFYNNTGSATFDPANGNPNIKLANGGSITGLSTTVGRFDVFKFYTVNGGSTWIELSRSLNILG
jgi:hypothetical protein